jgi:hydroxymethylbilane synthase
MKLRIGSRGSQLALWQANHIAGLLRGQGHTVEIEIIKTTGDRLQEATFAQVGSKGMFTKEIEEALAEGRVDLAVHSLKDLPTELPELFALAATPRRVDPRKSGRAGAGSAGGNQQPAAAGAVEGASARC